MFTHLFVTVTDPCVGFDCYLSSSPLIDGTTGATCKPSGTDCDCIPTYYPETNGSRCIRE